MKKNNTSQSKIETKKKRDSKKDEKDHKIIAK